MKKTDNKSKKLVKITYEYLGDKFVEKPNGWCENVLDNGDIVHGEWYKEWYEGMDEIPQAEVQIYLALAQKRKPRRHYVVQH